MRVRLPIILAVAALMALPALARAATYPAGFEERTAVTGLTQSVAMAFAADGTTFIAEKQGRVRVARPGASTATLLLDISSQVNEYGDRGMEGIAVDPGFATNGYVYLTYVHEDQPLLADADGVMTSRLVRIQVDPATLTLVNPGNPETVLLGKDGGAPCPTPSNTVDCLPADSDSHMIGTVRADPDGTLWVGQGDASSYNFVDDRALRTLNEQSLAGKILHIDRQGKGLPGHSFCPSDANLDHVCTKLFAKGFRNPYRFQLRLGGGVELGDVGWNTREELDVIPTGGKGYGWPCYEGTIRTPGYGDRQECKQVYAQEGTALAQQGPVYDYGRDQGSAVIGAPTYRGQEYPAGYRGSLFYGDYTATKLRYLKFDAQGQPAGITDFASEFFSTDTETGPDGNLWYVNFGTGAPGDGSIRKIVYSPGNKTPKAVARASITAGNAPLAVDFTGSDSTDADGDTLSYDWDFGDGSDHSTAANPSHTYTQGGTFTAKLTVNDGRGLSDTASIPISSNGSGPVATIDGPADQSSYIDGDIVQLSGTGTDEKDGVLPASAFSWRVILRHGEHTHFVSTYTGVKQASFNTRRDHDADSSYEITLTVTDSDGLTSSRTVKIKPQTVTARLESTPEGAPMSYGGRGAAAPFSQPTAVGYDTTVTAADSFVSDARPFYFKEWSDGGARVHDIRVPANDLTLRAVYEEDKAFDHPASASSSENSALGPGNAVDNDSSTRYSSSFADGQYWQVDLGRPRQVSSLAIDWETAYAKRYRILTSTDGQAFTDAASETISAAGMHTTAFGVRTARYVRVLGVERATQYGISFNDVRVLGPSDTSDGDPPQTTIDDGPTGSVATGSATLKFSSEPGATFECRLDGSAFAPCTSPRSYSGLGSGVHTFQVRATDTSGGVDPTPAEQRWTVDYGTNLALNKPATATSAEAPDFAAGKAVDGDLGTRWSSAFSDNQYWQVDLGATKTINIVELNWEAAYARRYQVLTSTDGQTFTQAAEDTISSPGPHATQFADRSARYVRILGVERATPYGISLIEAGVYGGAAAPPDTTPAETTLTSGPTGTSTSDSAAFAFTSEAGATFECSLDGAAYSTCSSPKSYSGLSNGSHTFKVRATDAAGNTDPTPESRTWTVAVPDTTPPDTTLAPSGPTGTVTTGSATFTFTSEAGATFECSLDSAAYSTCSSPKSYSGLSNGSHTFKVRAKDAAGNVDPTPESRTWTVAADTTPPDTTLGSGGPSGTVNVNAATFTFSSEAGATFECSLDTAAYAACTSPVTYHSLADGAHTFRVRAKDAAGNVDPTPATRDWTIKTYRATVLGTAGVFSYFGLGDTDTTARDWRSSRSGPYVNGPLLFGTLVPGSDSSHDFDGSNDYVDLTPAALGAPTAFSIEAWVRIDAAKPAGQTHFLVTDAATDLADGVSMWVDSANRPQIRVSKSATVGAAAVGTALTPGATAHVVGVYDGAAVRIYVNGVRRATTAYTSGVTWSATRDLLLGSQFKTTGRTTAYLNGKLDEVALYTAALSDATVLAHYNQGK